MVKKLYIFVYVVPGINEWREDVKRVLRTAGGLGRDVVFLILDSQLNNAAFLQDIDSMLNSGLVPNVFSVEEKQELIEVRTNSIVKRF